MPHTAFAVFAMTEGVSMVDRVATPDLTGVKGRLAMRLCHNYPIIGYKIITLKMNKTLVLQALEL